MEAFFKTVILEFLLRKKNLEKKNFNFGLLPFASIYRTLKGYTQKLRKKRPPRFEKQQSMDDLAFENIGEYPEDSQDYLSDSARNSDNKHKMRLMGNLDDLKKHSTPESQQVGGNLRSSDLLISNRQNSE